MASQSKDTELESSGLSPKAPTNRNEFHVADDHVCQQLLRGYTCAHRQAAFLEE